MGININITSYNGTVFSYGRVIGFEIDSNTKIAKVTLGGITHISNKYLEHFTPVLSTSFEMPEEVPNNLVEYGYNKLAETYTDIDFTEI